MINSSRLVKRKNSSQVESSPYLDFNLKNFLWRRRFLFESLNSLCSWVVIRKCNIKGLEMKLHTKIPKWTHEASIIINYIQFLICIAIITKIVLLLAYHKHFHIEFIAPEEKKLREREPIDPSSHTHWSCYVHR
jgi:hypothetical protein